MSKAGDTFDEFGKRMFDSECKPVERIYIDLEYMQDLRFGTLLNLVTVEAEMAYLYSKIPEYNNRYDNHTAKYFKALHVTDEQIEKALHHPSYLDIICVTSPFTSVYYTLNLFVAANNIHAKNYLDSPKKVHITINCSDVDYPKELQDRICATLSKQLSAEVVFVQGSRYSMSAKEYLDYDMLFLCDVASFINQHATEFVSNGAFVNKKIIAHPFIEDGILAKAENPEELILQTEKNLDIYCDFFFLKSEIVLESSKKE